MIGIFYAFESPLISFNANSAYTALQIKPYSRIRNAYRGTLNEFFTENGAQKHIQPQMYFSMNFFCFVSVSANE